MHGHPGAMAGQSGAEGGGKEARGFDEAVQRLSSLIVLGRAGQGTTVLPEVLRHCAALGVDLGALNAIHIAGTKGKGSTSAFTERVLRQAGLRTGLFTSPHLIDIRERVRINGKLLPKETFAKYFWEVHDTVLSDPATEIHYFHFVTILGFYIFSRENVQVAIVEVGLGGRLDATNALPAPVVCAITLIDLDHVAILGDTHTLIAREKAGILKRGVPGVVFAEQPPEALQAIQEVAHRVGAPLFIASPSPLSASSEGPEPRLGLRGGFQRKNAAVAVALTRIWFARCGALVAASAPALSGWSKTCTGAFAPSALPWSPGSSPSMGASTGGRDEPASGSNGPASGTENGPASEAPGAPVEAYGAGLEGFEKEALAGTKWPGRAQIVEGQLGGVKVHIDGAHTVESLRCCSAWFAEETKVSDRVRVLICNTTGGRGKQQLLSTLNLEAEGLGAAFGVVLFVPNDSSLEMVSVSGDGVKRARSAGSYKEQYALLQVWEALAEEGGASSSEPLGEGGEMLREEVESAVAAASRGGAGTARVAASIAEALAGVRAADAALGGGKVDLLCTGSLYLAGDVLAHLCPDTTLDL